MKKILVVAAAACAAAVLDASAQAPREPASFKAKTIERYCEKLRESPEAYLQFVQRLRTVYGYWAFDFVPEYEGAPVKADCRTVPARIAEAAPASPAGGDKAIVTLR